MRVRDLVLTLILMFCGVASAIAQDAPKADAPKAKGAAAEFEKFKALAGEWVGKGNHDGHEIDAVVTYKLTSGGSAVVETIGPGSEHEMVTVIHPDGEKLALTHYCAVGNQPQMQTKSAAAGKVEFDFVRGTNMKSDKDMHMHSVTFTFVDKDTLKTEWTLYKDGKAAGKALFDLKRKK
jgi:hypothetical protein